MLKPIKILTKSKDFIDEKSSNQIVNCDDTMKEPKIPSPTNENKLDNNINKSKVIVKGVNKGISRSITKAPTHAICHIVSNEQILELRSRAQEAAKQRKIFTIRGCFQSIVNALRQRSWVEKLDYNQRKSNFISNYNSNQLLFSDLAIRLPKKKPNETRQQHLNKCERIIMSRFVEHLPADFLWTDRKDAVDVAEQTRNSHMLINKFSRAPFTNKESLNGFLRELMWVFEGDIADVNFP